MKQVLFIFLLVAGTFLFFSNSSTVTDTIVLPDNEVQIFLISTLKDCKSEANTLVDLLENQSSIEEIQKQFLALRKPFKKVEFLLAYIDPQLYAMGLNGAPLPKVMKKVPDLTIIEPHGLQRMEELVYDLACDREELKTITVSYIKSLEGISEQRIKYSLTDPIVFEAVRFGIIRMNTMGVTGFDSPVNTDKSLNETQLYLKGIEQVLFKYKSYGKQDQFQHLAEICKRGIDLMSTNFDEFDRVKFHKEVVSPLWKLSLNIQESLRVELPHHRKTPPQPVNYMSEYMYSDDFLKTGYYAEYSDSDLESQRVELGRTLFFDPILSGNNERACASCHLPEKGFTDGNKTALLIGGTEFGPRNSPTIINSVYAERYFHDMRVDRLAFQMDHVVLNPGEFDSDYSSILKKLKHSTEYQNVFEQCYGQEGISKNTVTNAVTRYLTSIRSFNSPFDRFMRGESVEIDQSALRGFNLFSGKAGCATCHFAPTFAGLVPPSFIESESEVLGIPRKNKEPYELDDDMGRFANGLIKERAPFYERSFKTPTIRNIELTAPYMHNGAYETLEDVMEFYNAGGGIGLGLDVPHQTLPGDSLKLTDQEIDDIINFMKSLTDTVGLNRKPSHLPEIDGQPELNHRKIGGTY